MTTLPAMRALLASLLLVACSSTPTMGDAGTNPPDAYAHDGAFVVPELDAAPDAPVVADAGTCVAQCTMEGDGGTPAQCMALGGHCGDSPVHGGEDGGDGFLQCCLR